MTPLNLTVRDQRSLDRLSLDRFRELYPLPPGANLLFALDGELLIGVGQSAHVAELTGDAERLKHTAHIVFGAIGVSLWLGDAEVWSQPTSDSQLKTTRRLFRRW